MSVHTCTRVQVRKISNQYEFQIFISWGITGVTGSSEYPEKPLEAQNTNLQLTQILNFDHFGLKEPGKITF